MPTTEISWWLIAIVVTVFGPIVAALPPIIVDFFSPYEAGDAPGFFIFPMIAYIYGLPVSIALGGVAALYASITGALSPIVAYMYGPVTLIIVGWLFGVVSAGHTILAMCGVVPRPRGGP